MIETITYKERLYPKLVTEWNAAQYAIPFAKHFCKGVGFDIGTCKPEWAFPGAIMVDPALNEWDAMNLPSLPILNDSERFKVKVNWGNDVDYIFSSQCLEHIPDYVAALDYWSTRLKPGGTLFLYLPNMEANTYWQPQNNRKHLHFISPRVMEGYFEDRKEMWGKVIVTQGYDLNFSFYAICEKI